VSVWVLLAQRVWVGVWTQTAFQDLASFGPAVLHNAKVEEESLEAHSFLAEIALAAADVEELGHIFRADYDDLHDPYLKRPVALHSTSALA